MPDHLLMLIGADGAMHAHGTYASTPQDLARGQADARRLARAHPMLEAVLVPSTVVRGEVLDEEASEPPVRQLLLILDAYGTLSACGAYDLGQTALAISTRDDLARALPTHRAFLAPTLVFEAFTEDEAEA